MEIPAEMPDEPVPAVPAATVVVARDGEAGIEVLMLRRNSSGAFGGMWVFPGGRVDPADTDPAVPDDEVATARRAAARETAEEAGLVLDPEGLVSFAHWTPPEQASRRYATWFFLATSAEGHDVEVDGAEIHEHAWLTPTEALARQQAEEIELAPPTWVTLWGLLDVATAAEALLRARTRPPERFQARIAFSGPSLVAMWRGDAGYETLDAGAPRLRHRLWMTAGNWRYELTGTTPG